MILGLIEEDLKAVISKHIYGVSVGKVGTAEDMVAIDQLIEELERKSAGEVEIGTTKVIPWLETAKAIANANQICQASKRLSIYTCGTL